MKKKVVTSSLLMRFYANNGWSLDQLIPLVKKSISPEPFRYFDDKMPYWIPKIGTQIDIDKLVAIKIEVDRTFNDAPNEDDKTFLKRFIL